MSKENKQNQQTTANGGVVYSGPKTYVYNWDSISRFVIKNLGSGCVKPMIILGASPSASILKPIRVLAKGIEAFKREDLYKYNGIDDVIDTEVVKVKNQKILDSWLFTEADVEKIQQYGVSGLHMQKHEVEHIINDSVPRYIDDNVIYMMLDPAKVLKCMWLADNPDADTTSSKIEIKKSKFKNNQCTYTIEVRANKKDKKNKDYSELKRLMNTLYY